MTSYPEGLLPAIITTATNDTANNGTSGQSGAPRASPEVTDIDPSASPKRPTGRLLRVPSATNGLGEPASGSEVSRRPVLHYLGLTQSKYYTVSY
jgi:hypothetical protein